jgi:hypothetical protein
MEMTEVGIPVFTIQIGKMQQLERYYKGTPMLEITTSNHQ